MLDNHLKLPNSTIIKATQIIKHVEDAMKQFPYIERYFGNSEAFDSLKIDIIGFHLHQSDSIESFTFRNGCEINSSFKSPIIVI